MFKEMVKGKRYAEPCCGNGKLELLLRDCGANCVWASDIRDNFCWVQDALELTKEELTFCDLIITNPPFSWSLLKPLLDHLPTLKPTWLLLPANYMHNKRMGPYMKNCSDIISIGRLYWVNKTKGKEDYCWYQFHNKPKVTLFWGR
jgi:hypothetical protein